MSRIVHVIDVESGNLRSLENAIEYLGYTVKYVRSLNDSLDDATVCYRYLIFKLNRDEK